MHFPFPVSLFPPMIPLGSRYSPIIVIGVPARARGIFMDHATPSGPDSVSCRLSKAVVSWEEVFAILHC
jgi:hypothetical protein